jgi:hypothetical protein
MEDPTAFPSATDGSSTSLDTDSLANSQPIDDLKPLSDKEKTYAINPRRKSYNNLRTSSRSILTNKLDHQSERDLIQRAIDVSGRSDSKSPKSPSINYSQKLDHQDGKSELDEIDLNQRKVIAVRWQVTLNLLCRIMS